jgi:hypothetical protein
VKNRWLNRSVVYGLCTTLCTTEEQFLATHKKLTKKAYDHDWVWCKTGKACVHVLERKDDGPPAVVVCINVTRGDDVIRSLSLLAHEATHVKQELMRVIGEKTPSDEFEAYVIQNLCHDLFDEFERQWPSLPQAPKE